MFDPTVPLVGASGGVYSLFTAQLANVILVRNKDFTVTLPKVMVAGKIFSRGRWIDAISLGEIESCP